MMAVWLLMAAAPLTDAFWSQECPDRQDFALPDNEELDCSIRSLAFEYSQSVLGKGRRGQAKIHHALNL